MGKVREVTRWTQGECEDVGAKMHELEQEPEHFKASDLQLFRSAQTVLPATRQKKKLTGANQIPPGVRRVLEGLRNNSADQLTLQHNEEHAPSPPEPELPLPAAPSPVADFFAAQMQVLFGRMVDKVDVEPLLTRILVNAGLELIKHKEFRDVLIGRYFETAAPAVVEQSLALQPVSTSESRPRTPTILITGMKSARRGPFESRWREKLLFKWWGGTGGAEAEGLKELDAKCRASDHVFLMSQYTNDRAVAAVYRSGVANTTVHGITDEVVERTLSQFYKHWQRGASATTPNGGNGVRANAEAMFQH